jgi:hypothetical protein
VHEYVAAIHMHTTYSDGSATVPEIAREGEKAGVDVLLITDHCNDLVRRNGEEGWYGRVLVLSGYELNDASDKNHYLVFDLDECLPCAVPAGEYMRRVIEKGGIGIMAHPDEKRDVFPEHPPYEWTAWGDDGRSGIEIWNYMSEWMEGLRPGRRLYSLVFPDTSIHGPTPRSLRFWDDIAARRRILAIGSADAHCHRRKVLGVMVSIFPYERLFRRIRTHVLTAAPLGGSLADDRKAVFGALRDARVFISNMKYGDARGFTFTATGAGGTTWVGGDTELSGGLTLTVRTPLEGEITLLRNGVPVGAARGKSLEHRPREAGAYRVEVRRCRKPWIYSNHIRLM